MGKRRRNEGITLEQMRAAMDATVYGQPQIELMSQDEYEQRRRDLERYGQCWPYGIGRPEHLPK